MSHQTGIKSNVALRQLMAEAKMLGNEIRLFKAVINSQTEELELAETSSGGKGTLARGSWEADFEAYVRKAVSANEPCYLFFRMDSTNDSGKWIKIKLYNYDNFFCFFLQATTTGLSSFTPPSTATSVRRCFTRQPSQR